MVPFIQYLLLSLVALTSILAGVVGLILPFLPGVILIVGCVVLLSLLNPKVDAWLSKATLPYPMLHKMVENLRAFIGRIIGKK